MKCKAVLGMLALIGTLAVSATAAHAGSGGRPSALTSFFACYSINGHDSGKTVDVHVTDESPIFSLDRSNVRIGAGTLACAIVKLFVRQPNVPDPVLVEPDPTQATTFNAIKCYSVTGPGGSSLPGPAISYTALDAFFGQLGTLVPEPTDPPTLPPPPPEPQPGSLGTELGIQVSQLRYICGPAVFGLPPQ